MLKISENNGTEEIGLVTPIAWEKWTKHYNMSLGFSTKIKLCCYVMRSTRSPSWEIWWTVSRNYTVLFLSLDVKNTKFNQYLPVDLTSLNVSNSRFRKPVMFRRWRRHGVALWRHGRGAWHNCLLTATASNVNCWVDVAYHVTWLWQAGDTENFERRITGYLWAISRSRAAQSRDKPYKSLERNGHCTIYRSV